MIYRVFQERLVSDFFPTNLLDNRWINFYIGVAVNELRNDPVSYYE